RSAADNAEPFAKAFPIQIPAGQPCGPPRGVFALKLTVVEKVAGEVKRIAALDVGNAEFAEPRRNGIDRQPRSPPGADCVDLSDLAEQLDQGRVDLVLD